MVYLSAAGCVIAILGLWILPVIIGIKAAKRNNRSPHWMWFGVHPFGAWIAFLVLLFSKPLKSCPQCCEKVKAHAKICPYCTIPFSEPPSSDSFALSNIKNVRLWIIFLSLVGIIGIVGFLTFVSGVVESSFQDSSAYKQAIETTQNDPRILDLLGAPITAGTLASGSISTTGDASGEADLSIPISGPKGQARLYATGKLHSGIWTFSTLEVDPKNGQPRINLLKQP